MERQLPSEIGLLILEELNATDLSEYCASSRAAAHLCKDRVFWLNKVRTTSREELETEWVLNLARMKEYRLLSYLMNAVHADIDQWVVVTLLMTLYADRAPRRLVDAIKLHIDEKEVIERHFAPYGTFSSIQDVTNLLVERWQEFELGWRRDAIIGASPYILCYPALKFQEGFLKPLVGSMPSPKPLLEAIDRYKTIKEKRRAMRFINTWLLPHLVRNGEITILLHYRHQIERFIKFYDDDKYRRALDEIGKDQLHYTLMLDEFLLAVVENANLDTINVLFTNGDKDWDDLTAMADRPYDCADSETFFFLSTKIDYPLELSHGYITLSFDDWIVWADSYEKRFPSGENIGELITNLTLVEAEREGFTHFASQLRLYAKKKNYTIERPNLLDLLVFRDAQ